MKTSLTLLSGRSLVWLVVGLAVIAFLAWPSELAFAEAAPQGGPGPVKGARINYAAGNAVSGVSDSHAGGSSSDLSTEGTFEDSTWVSDHAIFYQQWLDLLSLLSEQASASLATGPATIDFETPNLGPLARMVIDPYIESITGVVFTSPAANAHVGLVKNRSTSACVDPPDENQKLGTAPVWSGSIGLAGFPIQAMFPTPLTGPVTISVEFQLLAGRPILLTLYDSLGTPVASTPAISGPPDGTCGFPGDPRARTVVTATSGDPVAYAVMEQLSNAVFVIDYFSFTTETIPATVVDPDTMYAFFANTVSPLELTAYLGNFHAGYTAAGVNTATLSINSTVLPVSIAVLPSHPSFDGNVIEVVFYAEEFIEGYGILFDASVQSYTVAGEYSDGTSFMAVGEFIFVGHRSGDVNVDGAVNISDLAYLVDFIFRGGPPPQIMELADLDGSCGPPNIVDFIYLVDFLFRGGTNPLQGCSVP